MKYSNSKSDGPRKGASEYPCRSGITKGSSDKGTGADMNVPQASTPSVKVVSK